MKNPKAKPRGNSGKTRANSVLIASIPIDRDVKRYWVRKFERIAANCGPDEAVRKFKNLRVQVLSYLSDKNRNSNRDKYLSSTGFRTNGMLRKLFEQAECQPHFVLSFLKLYSAETESGQSPEEADLATKERLNQVRANEAVPVFLLEWLNCVFSPHGRTYKQARAIPEHPFHYFAIHHTYDEWHSYWTKWYSVLRRGWMSSAKEDNKPVFPEVYKDYVESSGSSRSYERDFVELTAMHYLVPDDLRPLSVNQLEFVDGFLREDVRSDLLSEPANIHSRMPLLGIENSLLGYAVGQVQHIHKKGGGTELRDIAVPNRFIQAALVPGAARLYKLVRNLPKDATFDQSKFDTLISGRVNNSCLYQGSVDLSKATDNLPLSWGCKVVDTLCEKFWGSDVISDVYLSPEVRVLKAIFPSSPVDKKTERKFLKRKEERMSIELFYTVARANWLDGTYFVKWKVGQPLGSLPSFAMLAITHNLLVESLALSLGLGHSPYFILGDDIVITNKKLRKRYIRELSSRAIPLSLHKSFEGRLSEFAGKTYVKGSIPFYTSDHNPLTWESLFDWQRTTGIRIPWNKLPRPLRRKIERIAEAELSLYCGSGVPKRSRVVELAQLSYELVLTIEVRGRGTVLYPIDWDRSDVTERISGYFEYREDDSPTPEAVKHSGITLLGGSYPVTLLDYRFADKDGYFQRFRPVQLPAWYKAKVRPCATDAAIRAAVLSTLHYPSEDHWRTPASSDTG